MLVKHLPHDAPIWWAMERAEEEANRPKEDEIRDRAEFYRQQAAKQHDGGVTGG